MGFGDGEAEDVEEGEEPAGCRAGCQLEVEEEEEKEGGGSREREKGGRRRKKERSEAALFGEG